MLNSLPMWFILAMVVGYVFASNIQKASLLGLIYTITAITFYFIIVYFYQELSVKISFKDQLVSYVTWYGASAIGGPLGGIVGFLVKRTPFAYLSLLLGIFLQLFVNGRSIWSNIVGIAQNVTFCMMIGTIVIYLVMVTNKKKLNKTAASHRLPR